MTRLAAILRHRWYPGLPQALTFVFFGLTLVALFRGAGSHGSNAGSTITWLLWWPLIPLTFVLVGRFWCAICPFGAIGDFLQKHLGLGRRTPEFLKKHGTLFINFFFLAITWYDVSFGLTTSVPATARVLVIVLLAAATFSIVFEKRVWCKHLCFLGGIFGNYAQTAAVELQGNPDTCKSCTDLHCFNGNVDTKACALFITPKTIESNRTCNFCGDCFKSCEKDSPRLVLRDKPGKELWHKTKPRLDEALLAASLMGIIYVSTLGMLDIWPHLVMQGESLGLSGDLTIATVYLLGVIAAALSVYGLAAFVSARLADETWKKNFSRFGYGLIPLNLAIHLAHNLNHFLGEGKLIGPAVLQLAAIGTAVPAAATPETAGSEAPSMALLPSTFIQALQFGLVALGILASFYVMKRIAVASGRQEAPAWPHYIAVGLFGLVGFWLFSLPMMPRH